MDSLLEVSCPPGDHPPKDEHHIIRPPLKSGVYRAYVDLLTIDTTGNYDHGADLRSFCTPDELCVHLVYMSSTGPIAVPVVAKKPRLSNIDRVMHQLNEGFKAAYDHIRSVAGDYAKTLRSYSEQINRINNTLSKLNRVCEQLKPHLFIHKLPEERRKAISELSSVLNSDYPAYPDSGRHKLFTINNRRGSTHEHPRYPTQIRDFQQRLRQVVEKVPRTPDVSNLIDSIIDLIKQYDDVISLYNELPEVLHGPNLVNVDELGQPPTFSYDQEEQRLKLHIHAGSNFVANVDDDYRLQPGDLTLMVDELNAERLEGFKFVDYKLTAGETTPTKRIQLVSADLKSRGDIGYHSYYSYRSTKLPFRSWYTYRFLAVELSDMPNNSAYPFLALLKPDELINTGQPVDLTERVSGQSICYVVNGEVSSTRVKFGYSSGKVMLPMKQCSGLRLRVRFELIGEL